MRTRKGHILLKFISLCSLIMFCLLWMGSTHFVRCESGKTYVGSEACRACHEKEYSNFMANAKKSRSFENIEIRKKGLSAEEINQCYECHTTAYGQLGGFRSEAETPHLKNVGCEVCHGPGSVHVKTANPRDIKGHLTVKDCEGCHSEERVAAFNYKPLIFGGAH
jgi:hypothetical protein